MKIFQKITISLLSFLFIFLSLQVDNQQAFAAQGDCPQGFEQVIANGARCTAVDADAALSCPSEYSESREDGLLICNKKAQKVEAFDGDLANDIKFLNWINRALNSILWPILILIGGLLDTSLLFGNGMEARLLAIWVPIRNLVNILMVLVLLGIALYNTLGIGEEGGTYSVKSALPKIVVAIIAINFSFLGMKVFLDAVNVMTTAVFSLPNQVGAGVAEIELNDQTKNQLCATLQRMSLDQLKQTDNTELEKQELDELYVNIASSRPELFNELDKNPTTAEQVRSALKPDQNPAFQQELQKRVSAQFCAGKTITTKGEQFLQRFSSRNAAFAMALNMGKILQFEQVTIDSLLDVEKLAINTILGILFYFVYAASFIALFVVLLARLLAMWAIIAASPVIVLFLIIPELKDKIGGGSDMTGKFIKTAISPIIIGLVMTVGWIMLKAIQNIDARSSNSILTVDPTQGIPIAGLNTLQDLLVSLATVGVVWVGVFAAADGTIADKATNWMKDNLQRAGRFLGNIPLKHAPFIPIKIPGEGDENTNYSLGEVAYALDNRLRDTTNSDRLYEKLRNKDSKTQAIKFTDINSTKEFTSSIQASLANNGGKFSKQELRELRRIMQSSKGDRFVKEIHDKGGSTGREFAKAFGQLKEAEDKDLNGIGIDIARTAGRYDATNPRKYQKAAKTAETVAATSAAAPRAVDINKTTNFQGTTIENHLPVDPSSQALPASDKRDNLLKEEVSKIEKEFKALDVAILNNDKSAAEAALKKIRINGWDQDGNAKLVTPTTEDIKTLLGGQSPYDKLTAIVGDVDEHLK